VSTSALTIASDATVDQSTGAVTVHGTYTCNGSSLGLYVQPRQWQGSTLISKRILDPDPLVCDGQSHDWSTTVDPDSGNYQPGTVNVQAFFMDSATTKQVIQDVSAT
jgi:hypothetical protein